MRCSWREYGCDGYFRAARAGSGLTGNVGSNVMFPDDLDDPPSFRIDRREDLGGGRGGGGGGGGRGHVWMFVG
jgi:hypothetical protein